MAGESSHTGAITRAGLILSETTEAQPQQVIDLSGVSGTWCLAHLFLPEDLRDRGLYATAMNFLVNAEGALVPGWDVMFPKVVDALRNGPPQNPVATFPSNGPPQNPVATFPNRKPILSIVKPDDATG